jgi:hypothetical protein
MDHPSCDRTNCINWKSGRCTLKDPEKEGDNCLNFEDAMDFLRLKADAIKGSLGYDEFKDANKAVT